VHDLHDLWQATTAEGVPVVGQPVDRSLPFYSLSWSRVCIRVMLMYRIAERSCQQRNPDSASGKELERADTIDNAFIFDLAVQ